jgi:hypothetical protein
LPTKRIIILDFDRPGTVHFVMRADVPPGQEGAYARSDYTSIVGDPVDPDLTAIRNGTVTERIEQAEFDPVGGEAPTAFRDRVQAGLEAAWAAFQADVTARQPRRFFGRWWGGTTWT